MMNKRKLLLFTALCALAFTGCKKRETIDLSSLHTTAAALKETLTETEAAPDSIEESEESSAAANAASLKTELAKETIGNATIEYPVISNMKDSEKQEKANALLKSNALSIADVHPDSSLTVKATVESANLRRITVTYKGELTASGKKQRIFYSNTIDLETLENLGLQDFSDIYTVAGYLVSGDYKLSDVSGSEESVRKAINGSGQTVESWYEKLKDSDFTGGYTEDGGESPASHWPSIFSYEKQGVVYLALPMEGTGGYVLVHYSPDNK